MDSKRVDELLERFKEEVEGVKEALNVTFSDNLVVASGCTNYGCRCISHEMCCGCLLQ